MEGARSEAGTAPDGSGADPGKAGPEAAAQGNAQRKPGYGIWNDYFSSNNTEFVYSYLILNSPVNCSRIAVVDHRNNSLNITEMAVFSEDPLKNLNHEKYEQAGDYMEIGWSAEEVTSEPAISNIEGVMINGNPDAGFTLPAGLTNYISIKTKAVAPVNHILCWSEDSDKTLILDNDLRYAFGENGLISSDYFVPLKSLSDGSTWTALGDNIDTPFIEQGGKAVGNPLPYSPGGIDSPRTFAWKMKAQLEARKAVFDSSPVTTAADGDSYSLGYADQKDLAGYSADLRPFLPGYYKNIKGYYNSSIRPEQSAGVDSLGIVQGTMAMFGEGSFIDADGTDAASDLDNYYAMAGSLPGLKDNFPVFDSDSTNGYELINKLTPADIERNSVVIPDISMIQEGDLLVRNNEKGSHVGVVVGFLAEVPSTPTEARLWWDNVLVVSTRAGFQMANLGTWGNRGGIFGGFAEDPEDYVIRRLVRKTGSSTVPARESWECVKTIYPQWYTHYTEYKKVAEHYIKYIDEIEKNKYQKMKDENKPFYTRLPPTSMPDKRLIYSIFHEQNSQTDPKSRISSLTGWRAYSGPITYHRGLDLYDSEGRTKIYAPEDGLYWVINQNPGSGHRYIQISNNEILVVDYYGPIFGDIGVLVTPHRIYLFCHMDYDDLSSLDLPTSYLQAKSVKKGDQIGIMGANSNGEISDMGAHIHFEVYERFENYQIKVAELEKKKDDIRFKNYNNSTESEEFITIDFVKNNIRWQRVDPLTVLPVGGYVLDNNGTIEKDADNIPYIAVELQNENTMGADNVLSITELGTLFSVWTAPMTWEGDRYEESYK